MIKDTVTEVLTILTCLYPRPMAFLNCSDPLDLKDNTTEQQEKGYGCTKVCTGEHHEISHN